MVAFCSLGKRKCSLGKRSFDGYVIKGDSDHVN